VLFRLRALLFAYVLCFCIGLLVKCNSFVIIFSNEEGIVSKKKLLFTSAYADNE